jgi:hypothetical protein
LTSARSRNSLRSSRCLEHTLNRLDAYKYWGGGVKVGVGGRVGSGRVVSGGGGGVGMGVGVNCLGNI